MTFVLSIIYDGREETQRKRVWYIIAAIFLIVLAGLRNGIGGDTLDYRDEFEDSSFASYTSMAEYLQDNLISNGRMPLWSIFVTICYSISDSFYFFQFVHAIIVIIPIFYLFRKYSNYYFLCVLVYGLAGYFFLFNTEVLRESIAIVCSIFAIHYYFKGGKSGYIRYAVLVLVGILFHASASILLIFPLVHYIPIRRSTVFWGVFAAFILWFISDYIIEQLPTYIFLSDASLARKISSYSEIKSNFFGFLSDSLRYICFPFFVMYYCLKNEEDSTLYAHKEHFIAFMLVIGIFAVGINGFARINNYVALYYIIALSEFIYLYIHSPKYLFITRTIVLLGLMYYHSLFYRAYYPSSHRYHFEYYYPYTSILDDDNSYDFRYEMHHESTEIDTSGKPSRSE